MPVEQAKRGGNSVTLGRHQPIEPERRRCCVCVRVRACARAGVCVRVRACVHANACVRDVFAIYDNNISPWLIMIIIKIIRHTDDFPSTGTRIVCIYGYVCTHTLYMVSASIYKYACQYACSTYSVWPCMCGHIRLYTVCL